MGTLSESLFLCLLFFPYNFSYFTINEEEIQALEKLNKDDAVEAIKSLEIFGEDYGIKWLAIPDGDGIPQIALLEPLKENTTEKENVDEKFIFEKYEIEDMPNFITLIFYSRNYPNGKIFNFENLKDLTVDSSKPTKLIVHGWRANNESSMMTAIKDAYLSEQDVNAITIDWGSISKDIVYTNAAKATELVGMHVASVIDSLSAHHNVKYEDIHLVGHSLGAHIAGFIGSNTKQRIGRITGLDPALPGFQNVVGPEGRLDPSDANFVDAIHTACGTLGMSINVGHADFFPNGGSAYQPGCSFTFLPTMTRCSHARSHEYFAESIKHANFKAIKCLDWKHFKNNDCEKNYILMGEYATPDSSGMFFLKTLSSKPFAMDLNGTFY